MLKNVHEPIIERSIWEYVQQKRQRNKRTRKARKQSLFSGFLRCGGCGSNLHYHFNQNSPSIEYYNCSNYIGNRGTCPNTHYVRLDYLTEQVLSEINLLLANAHSDWDNFTQTIQQHKIAQAKEVQKALRAENKSLSNRQEELAAIIANLYEDKTTGEVDDETYNLLSKTFKSERSDNRQKCQQLQEHIQDNQNAVDGVERFLNTLDAYSIIEEMTREVLHELVDFISVYPAIRNGKEYTQQFEIYYHYVGQLDRGKSSVTCR